MEQKIIDELFSKDKLWYNENIHSNIMKKILSLLLDISAEKLYIQDEYRVQATINDYISGQLRNTPFEAGREWKNIDNRVFNRETDEPMVLYEVKSYIKPHENTINKKLIYKDILKLAIKKKESPHIKAYLIIAGKTKVLKDAILTDKKLLLPEKFNDTYNRESKIFQLSDFEKLEIEKRLINKANTLSIEDISISPSRWKNYDGMCAVSWKINKI